MIHKTLLSKWQAQGHGQAKIDALWNDYVPRHLLPRLHGYEILMAPYAIAHLKIGLKLFETGYRFRSNERARVYLTNALEPAGDFSGRFEFAIPALAHEAQAVNEVKRKQRFTVLMGNPPYSISSANRGRWIEELMADYKQGLNETNLNSLSDDYIKFIRLTHHLAKITGNTIIGLITNNSFLDGITHRKIRELLFANGHLRVVNLHGSVMQRNEIPQGCCDENVFDIQQGVAIWTLSPVNALAECRTQYADLIGPRADKYERLLRGNLPKPTVLSPRTPYFFFKPKGLADESEYLHGFPINRAFIKYSSGIKFRKDNLLVKRHFTRGSVEDMLRDVARLPDADLLAKYEFDETADWRLEDKRKLFMKWDAQDIIVVMYRALDFRFAFYPLDRANQIIVRGDSRVDLMRNVVLHKNIGLQFNRQIVGESVSHFLASRAPTSQGTFYLGNKGQDYFAPLYLYGDSGHRTGLLASGGAQPNLTPEFLTAIAEGLGMTGDGHGLPKGMTPEDIFHYAYAVFHSPGYRMRYAEFLKIDFPRLPLTGSLQLFTELTRLGGELVSFHVLESPKLAIPTTEFRGGQNTEVEKVSYSNNTVWIDKAQSTGFRGVPEDVWNFHIGGYQVCEKWLKDRQAKGGKNPRPGRKLSGDDIAHYQKIVVALSETIRLMQEIDAVIDRHGGWPGAFTPGAAPAPDSDSAPPAPDAPPAPLHAWQMTRGQYQTHCKAQGRTDLSANNRAYWREIESALQAGHPVPENVRKEYRQLKGQK